MDKKLRNISLRGLFSLYFWRNVYRSTLFPQTLNPYFPSLKKIWVHTCTGTYTSTVTLLCTASATFRIIKAYSSILRQYLSIFRLIQAYSAPWVTFAYLQPCHTLSPGIFRTGGFFKPFFKRWTGIFRTLLNCIIQLYSGILRTLTYAETWHTWNPGIFRILPLLHPDAYSDSEPRHINKNLRIFRALTIQGSEYSKSDIYSEPSQRFKMGFLQK